MSTKRSKMKNLRLSNQMNCMMLLEKFRKNLSDMLVLSAVRQWNKSRKKRRKNSKIITHHQAGLMTNRSSQKKPKKKKENKTNQKQNRYP